jgi:ADP-ribose pyrophosphatase YjhB (NUDIX family)
MTDEIPSQPPSDASEAASEAVESTAVECEAAAGASAEPTHVVTSFLLRSDRGRDEILLVQRSQRVRTYRGAWGGVSGYLEPGVTPLEQAYTEIAEETSLPRDTVRLLREGQPLAFRDEALAQSWVVHPFLFALDAPDRIQTDWEATTSRWVAPEEVAVLPTVPMLAVALALVYP